MTCFESFPYLLPGLRIRRGLDEVTATDPTPSGAVIGDRHRRVDELVVNYISFVGHYTAACELADAPLWSCAHHLTVNSEVLGGERFMAA